jgi:hypothetical protein
MKNIRYLLLLLLVGCSGPELEMPEGLSIDDIFSVNESNVTNGESIHFDLPEKGTYTLTLIDKESGQTISREKFIGQSGENVKKIYTKSLQSRYLYLLLEDVTKKELGKTTIIIK